jgi:hypothetical protein
MEHKRLVLPRDNTGRMLKCEAATTPMSATNTFTVLAGDLIFMMILFSIVALLVD